MPLPDIAVLLAIALGTPALGALLWRRGVRGRRFFTAMWVGFYGLVLTVMMTAHCLDVLSRLYVGRGYDGAAFPYDFRAYALLLLGALVVGCGARVLRAGLGLGSADPASRREGIRVTVAVLAVVAPLIPIHSFFAIPLTVLGVLTLAVLLWAAPKPAERVLAPPLPEPRPVPEPVGV
ncbi:MAG TPA: hypothetical protein VGR37_19785 [Longimicrobiaceae bacterium]|nr:hypothetical protein [Longimicrobiaceae bacterium]